MVESILLIDSQGKVEATSEALAADLQTIAPPALGLPFEEVLSAPGHVELIFAVRRIRSGSVEELRGELREAERNLAWVVTRVRGRDHQFSVLVRLSPLTAPARGEAMDPGSYRETFEHAIEGIFRTTLDGHYLEANRALARIYGFPSPECLIEALGDLNTQLYVEPGRRAEFVRQMQSEGYVADFESEVFRADGSRIWITEFARTAFDRSGQPLFFEGSVVDVTKRHLDAAALRESELKFRSLVENLNVVPWEAELETGKLIYLGPQAVEMLGYPSDEWFEPDFLARHVHPEDRDWVSVAKAEAFSKSERFELEYRFLRKDGEVIWVRDMMGVIRSDREPRIIGGFLLDVTYHRFTEASLKESQSFFEHLASAAPVIFYLYSLKDGQCLYVNGQALEMLGFSKQTLHEMKPFFVLALGHPDEMRDHHLHFEQITSNHDRRVFEREFRLRRADGDWVWLRSRESIMKWSRDGTPRQIVGIATDITVRRFALEELANDEQLFRGLVETAKVVPFEFNTHARRLTYVGPQAEALFGHATKRWYTEGFGVSIVHPDDQNSVTFPFGDFEGTAEGEAAVHWEFRLRKSNGDYLWVKNVVPASAEERRTGIGRGFLLDISDMKRREEELDRSRRQLRELVSRSQTVREEERIRIARELHDELGQALTLSRIDLEWIESTVRTFVPSKDEERLVGRIGEMKERMKATIDTLRRIYTNLRPPILDELGLQAAIGWQAREFSRRVGIRCDAVVGEVEPADKEVATATFRIFQEILTNIAKHAAATSVKVNLEVLNERLKLVVSDNGRGFSPEARSETKGFGILGMKERTEALGGRIDFKSSPGEGTVISVEFSPLLNGSRTEAN